MSLGGKWIAVLVLLPEVLLATELQHAIHTDFWLGLSLLSFNYEEFYDDGSTANVEEGLIPGITSGLTMSQDRWFALTSISAWSGDVDYQGPVNTNTAEKIIDWSILAGRKIYLREKSEIGLFAGFGYHNWERDIQSTPITTGLFETYDWWYVMAGVRGGYHLSPSTQFRVDACFTRTLNPRIKVEFETNFDDVTLELSEKTGNRLIMTLDHRFNNTMRAWISSWYETWELGRSSTQDLTSSGLATATIFEPRSETENFGVNMGVSWEFGSR